MFRPPFLARVAAGAAVYALEESRRLPTAAMNLPITAISQVLQTTMHIQQFVTSLALKGDAVFDRLSNRPVDQPEWATFDEDLADDPNPGTSRTSRFDLYTADDPEPFRAPDPFAADDTGSTNGHVASVTPIGEPPAEDPDPDDDPAPTDSDTDPDPAETTAIVEPEVAARYDYANMTLAQLRARLRLLTLDDLTALLEYEQHTRARAPFVTMLTNRIATVQAQ
ncbi:lipid droplet-associated protein [Nocardia sp. NPDC019255]|uniref:lipid droplet-associated protein n=1 Tax=Nocardia sp. NPDC019255 TaxID=3154591 RepID=UPI0033D5E554